MRESGSQGRSQQQPATISAGQQGRTPLNNTNFTKDDLQVRNGKLASSGPPPPPAPLKPRKQATITTTTSAPHQRPTASPQGSSTSSPRAPEPASVPESTEARTRFVKRASNASNEKGVNPTVKGGSPYSSCRGFQWHF